MLQLMTFDPEVMSYSTESHGKGLMMGEDVKDVGLLEEDNFGDGERMPTTTLSEVATAAAPSLADSIIDAAIGSFSLIIRTG